MNSEGWLKAVIGARSETKDEPPPRRPSEGPRRRVRSHDAAVTTWRFEAMQATVLRMRRSSQNSSDATSPSDSIDEPMRPTASGTPSSVDREHAAALGSPRRRVDPLWIMLLLGGLLFVVESWRSPERGDDVVITHERVAASETTLRRALGRDPTPAELDASLQGWIDAEIAVREARRLGLDRDDPIVRRRLVQKVEQILESTWDDRAPTSDEIDAWIAEHPDRYRNEANVDLTHVFVAATSAEEPTKTEPPARALAIRDALARSTGADPTAAIADLDDAGDAFVHGSRLRGQSRAAIVAKFGESFAEAIFARDGEVTPSQGSTETPRPAIQWRVLASKHGWHVVSVEARRDAKDGSRDVVAGQAARDWLEAQRDATREAERARLRGRYRVVREGGA
jgi:peptidyl-prolyl cis-trans isomerase C